jgi:hypothetical protein
VGTPAKHLLLLAHFATLYALQPSAINSCTSATHSRPGRGLVTPPLSASMNSASTQVFWILTLISEGCCKCRRHQQMSGYLQFFGSCRPAAPKPSVRCRAAGQNSGKYVGAGAIRSGGHRTGRTVAASAFWRRAKKGTGKDAQPEPLSAELGSSETDEPGPTT